MSVKKPTRVFTAIEENPSLGNNGPTGLKTDIDTINKMFDPNATHETGEAGGIQIGNMATGEVTDTPTAGKIVKYDSNGNLPGSIASAADVTTNINGHAIADILEVDGVTVKEATHAGSADELSGTTGGKWVEIINTTVDVPTGTINFSLKLRPGGQHNIYSFSVYVVSPIAGIYQAYGVPNQANAYITRIHENQSGDNRDYLSIKNDLPFVDITVAAKVWVWESS